MWGHRVVLSALCVALLFAVAAAVTEDEKVVPALQNYLDFLKDASKKFDSDEGMDHDILTQLETQGDAAHTSLFKELDPLLTSHQIAKEDSAGKIFDILQDALKSIKPTYEQLTNLIFAYKVEDNQSHRLVIASDTLDKLVERVEATYVQAKDGLNKEIIRQIFEEVGASEVAFDVCAESFLAFEKEKNEEDKAKVLSRRRRFLKKFFKKVGKAIKKVGGHLKKAGKFVGKHIKKAAKWVKKTVKKIGKSIAVKLCPLRCRTLPRIKLSLICGACLIVGQKVNCPAMCKLPLVKKLPTCRYNPSCHRAHVVYAAPTEAPTSEPEEPCGVQLCEYMCSVNLMYMHFPICKVCGEEKPDLDNCSFDQTALCGFCKLHTVFMLLPICKVC